MTLSDLERRLEALERRLPQGMMVSTTYGRAEVRPFQVGFPVVLTSAFDSTTGYSWSQNVLDPTIPAIDAPDIPRTGDMAFTPDNNESLQVGQAGWLEVDPQAGGWVFDPSYSFLVCSGSGSGSGGDSGSGSGSGSCTCPVQPDSPWSSYLLVDGQQLWQVSYQTGVCQNAAGQMQLCQGPETLEMLGCLTQCTTGGCNGYDGPIDCGSGSGCASQAWASEPPAVLNGATGGGASCFGSVNLDTNWDGVQEYIGPFISPCDDNLYQLYINPAACTASIVDENGDIVATSTAFSCAEGSLWIEFNVNANALFGSNSAAGTLQCELLIGQGCTPAGGYVCINGSCYETNWEAQYATLAECQAACSGSGSGSGSGGGAGYVCLDGSCIYTSQGAEYQTLAECQAACNCCQCSAATMTVSVSGDITNPGTYTLTNSPGTCFYSAEGDSDTYPFLTSISASCSVVNGQQQWTVTLDIIEDVEGDEENLTYYYTFPCGQTPVVPPITVSGGSSSSGSGSSSSSSSSSSGGHGYVCQDVIGQGLSCVQVTSGATWATLEECEAACGGSGSSSSGSSSGSSSSSSSAQCPDSGTVDVTLSGFSGACAFLNNSYTLTYSEGSFGYSGTSALGPFTITYTCTSSTSGTVVVGIANPPQPPLMSGTAVVSGSVSPMDMVGAGLVSATSEYCANQTFEVDVT